jgi:hypothetical protein
MEQGHTEMRALKNTRLVTNRSFPVGFEAIEQQPNGVLVWVAEEDGVSVYFPCDADFAGDVFLRTDRTLDVERLPVPYRSAFDWVA